MLSYSSLKTLHESAKVWSVANQGQLAVVIDDPKKEAPCPWDMRENEFEAFEGGIWSADYRVCATSK